MFIPVTLGFGIDPFQRIHDVAKECGVSEVAPDVSAVIAYAVQQRLKNLLERLNLIAEHRMEVLRVCSFPG